MNYSMISYILGWIFNFEAAFMILPGITAIITGKKWSGISDHDADLPDNRNSAYQERKEKAKYSMPKRCCYSCSQLAGTQYCRSPSFYYFRKYSHPIDAIFETVSGFTTTGASILSDVEALSHCMLIWRSFTHWIGGMGVLVFILCLLPLTGGYHMNLMKAESPGPSVSKLVPKVQSTAKILYTIYIILTVVEIIFLLIGKMPLFDTLCLSFGTAGTGGFGIKNDSIASYSTYNQVVITVFMILFGINFNAYYLLLTKKVMQAAKNEEVRYYLGIIGLAIVAIAINTREMFTSFGRAFQQAAFQVGSIITTTGYATTDFNVWPVFSKTILVILMFVGACAGSTGGGIKVSRLLILCKSARKELQLYLHPNAVKKIKMDDKAIPHEVVRATNMFLFVYIMIFVISLLIISLDNLDMVSNFTAIAATLNNIGPGLGAVGPTGNFDTYSYISKAVMIFDMLAGRLEVFPLLLLFKRDTWKVLKLTNKKLLKLTRSKEC